MNFKESEVKNIEGEVEKIDFSKQIGNALYSNGKDVEICEPAVSSDVQAFCSAKLVEGEQTKYGRHVLPDSAGGAGPLYFCLLRKKSVCSVEELSMV